MASNTINRSNFDEVREQRQNDNELIDLFVEFLHWRRRQVENSHNISRMSNDVCINDVKSPLNDFYNGYTSHDNNG